MVIILSTSIVVPSVVPLWQDHCDQEISQENGEKETEKENSKELEEKDPFFETYTSIELAFIEDVTHYNNFYSSWLSDFSPEITTPPPKMIG